MQWTNSLRKHITKSHTHTHKSENPPIKKKLDLQLYPFHKYSPRQIVLILIGEIINAEITEILYKFVQRTEKEYYPLSFEVSIKS